MSNTMTKAEMLAEIERLQQANADLAEAAKPKPKQLSCKVSQKGAVSVYGMGRFPVTLYQSQWERLIEFVPTVKAFIADNQASLAVKE